MDTKAEEMLVQGEHRAGRGFLKSQLNDHERSIEDSHRDWSFSGDRRGNRESVCRTVKDITMRSCT